MIFTYLIVLFKLLDFGYNLIIFKINVEVWNGSLILN